MIEKFTALAANSFIKIQFQNLEKKKEAVPEGRASDWNSLVAVPLARRDTLLLHDARHERGSRE